MPKLEVGLVVEGALQGHEVCDDVEYVFEVITSAPVDVGKAIDDAMEAAKLAWPNADEYFLTESSSYE